MSLQIIIIIMLSTCSSYCNSDLLTGPDPWNYEVVQRPDKQQETDLPPDLRTPLKKERPAESKFAYGEWWFKRLLAIVLKNGQFQENEEGIVDISLQMRFEPDRWQVLDEYLKSESPLSNDKFRRSVGFVEDAIYKPTITDKIVMAWSDYIQVYLMEYKTYITLLLGLLAAVGVVMWLWKHMSHKHVIIIILAFLYVYEVFISYKEAEQQEYEKFVSAVNTCKWYFWTTECTVPPPDPLLFMKHMNPLKIAIRMFTSFISEPIIAINSTIKIMLHGVTDGLMFPFDKIVYGFSILVVNISLIYLLVMVVFNFIFNIPFNLNFLGVVSVGVRQNRRSLFSTNRNEQAEIRINDADRISGDRLDRLLNVCSLALTNINNVPNRAILNATNNNVPMLRRSASTGRLPNSSSDTNDQLAISSNFRRRINVGRGDGDH
ncbi:hypothetical protein HF086_007530 [Spodoptera exigua]|uniref:Chloride channel CLIC-like protein 1 n=1 Tax=Spodoptera exigua TaxID=7107 RepID=A0A922S981_SPOEX|nr:hypothetical protein HF086_007530 [Spodoptera exigua]